MESLRLSNFAAPGAAAGGHFVYFSLENMEMFRAVYRQIFMHGVERHEWDLKINQRRDW
jgi:hypothetical protein